MRSGARAAGTKSANFAPPSATIDSLMKPGDGLARENAFEFAAEVVGRLVDVCLRYRIELHPHGIDRSRTTRGDVVTLLEKMR